MNFWQVTKAWIGGETGLPDSTLHMIGGGILLFLAAAVLRRLPWNWRPWLVVLLLELANETYDMLNPSSGEDSLAASWHDVWATMLWPTALLLLVPMLIRRARGAPGERRDGQD